MSTSPALDTINEVGAPPAEVRPARLRFSQNSALLKWGLVALFMSAAFKPRTIDELIDGGATTLPDYVLYVQSYSIIFGLLAIILFFLSVVRNVRPSSLADPVLIILITLQTLAVIRLFFIDIDLAIATLPTLLVTISLWLAVASSISRYGYKSTSISILAILDVCSIVYLVQNILLLLSGYGTNDYVNRFYGDTAHPNFLAVQLAFIICLQTYLIIRRSRVIARSVLIAATMYIIVMCGSRTGLVAAFVGAFIVWLKSKPSPGSMILMAYFGSVAVLLIYIAFIYNPDIFSGFERGLHYEDRDIVWLNMWREIQSSPFFGDGVETSNSENSFLRGWAKYGFLFPVGWGFIYLRMLLKSQYSNLMNSPTMPLWLGMIACSFAASLFEGILAERFSLQLILTMLAILMVEKDSGADGRPPAIKSAVPLMQ